MLIETLFIVAFILIVLEALFPAMGVIGLMGFAAYFAGAWMVLDSEVDQFYGMSPSIIIGIGVVYAAALAILVFVMLKNRAKKVETGVEYLKGQTATVTSWGGTKGKVFIDGEDWRAEGPEGLKANDEVTVTDYDNLTLTVKKKD
jgi:membrane-bound serine protease (ClpP class)